MKKAQLEQEVQRQLSILRRGTAEIVSEEGLATKIRSSLVSGKPLRVKLGADPSAPDLHLGHAVVLDKLREFQDLGHQVVFIIGDYTARIGDPSGRSKTRPPLTGEQIDANATTYFEQVCRILDPQKTEVRYNGEWLSRLTFEEIIRLASRFTIQQILERDDFSKRYHVQVPIFFHEFFYPLMQAYDSVAVEADVELGGTDQKFNFLLARQLQEQVGQVAQVAFMMPILPGLDGIHRMSKSLGNYIGIAENAVDMYGKSMSIPDGLMEQYFTLLTSMPEPELQGIVAGIADGSVHPMTAKKRLAFLVTERFHGTEGAAAAQANFENVFSKRASTASADIVYEDVTLPAEFAGFPEVAVIDLLFGLGAVPSKSEARRLIQQGGIEVEGQRVADIGFRVSLGHSPIHMRVGKKRFLAVNL
ncbi:tyrosine--tRNA ligase [Candidatus Cryosericum septentrionale]|uniref:Tyrosine--tRNA ligase n=1 Tax=Candidatus Cryosericum septentrionale TaxID=2290913 RepID=A0A398DMN6_9BACT|nr:tyrosine--tRNA ligase [Candidatus Cryosericum septentrionale]RIE16852.1 tyrosine--tRNA ligase [Candidatus Cryosericum septentrionale]